MQYEIRLKCGEDSVTCQTTPDSIEEIEKKYGLGLSSLEAALKKKEGAEKIKDPDTGDICTLWICSTSSSDKRGLEA